MRLARDVSIYMHIMVQHVDEANALYESLTPYSQQTFTNDNKQCPQ